MNKLSPETIKDSAINYLRELGNSNDADLLERCQIEISDCTQNYCGTTILGLNFTLRCSPKDLSFFESTYDGIPGESHYAIEKAINSILPSVFKVHHISARSTLVSDEFERTELVKQIEAQKDLMISVSTGGPRIQEKNEVYKSRRKHIKKMLNLLDKEDPNEFDDLWAWYGRWSSGDLPTYKSRREYVRNLYKPLLDNLDLSDLDTPLSPKKILTGWQKVDRILDKIISGLPKAKLPEDYQGIGLLCRECIISLAQAVYDKDKHLSSDGVIPSETDAKRMLEAYFNSEFSGSKNEALRKHAKASLDLANDLQHRTTAKYINAALCAEATRTVVNIVAITSEKK